MLPFRGAAWSRFHPVTMAVTEKDPKRGFLAFFRETSVTVLLVFGLVGQSESLALPSVPGNRRGEFLRVAAQHNEETLSVGAHFHMKLLVTR